MEDIEIIVKVMGFLSVSSDILILIWFLILKKIRIDIIKLIFLISILECIYLISDITIFSNNNNENLNLACSFEKIFDISTSVSTCFLITLLNLNLCYNQILKRQSPNLNYQILACFLTTIITTISILFLGYPTDPKCNFNEKYYWVIFSLYDVPIFFISIISIITFFTILLCSNKVKNEFTTNKDDNITDENKIDFNRNVILINDKLNKNDKNKKNLSEDFANCKSFILVLLNFAITFGVVELLFIRCNLKEDIKFERFTSILSNSGGLINFIIFISNKFIRTSIIDWWKKKKPYVIK